MSESDKLMSDLKNNFIDVREAASTMGKARTAKKIAAARENGKLGGRPRGSGRPYSEDAKARMRIAQAARRERERLADHLHETEIPTTATQQ